jgi:hypothetical protein
MIGRWMGLTEGRPYLQYTQHRAAPPLGVVFRQVRKDFERGFVVEASQACSIVVADEAQEEFLSIGLAEEVCPVACVVADFRQGAQGFGEAAVEALDHAIGARGVGPGRAVADARCRTDAVERVVCGRPGGVAGLGSVSEAVGEFRSVIGQRSVNRVGKSS